MNEYAKKVINTPIGRMKLEADEFGLKRSYLLPMSNLSETNDDTTSHLNTVKRAQGFISLAHSQIDEYFQGTRQSFDVPLSISSSGFQERSWNYLLSLPFGSQVTYKQQALALGGPSYARAVGMANSKNPLLIFIPCHRVVRSNGDLGGFAAGVLAKQRLLAHEKKIVEKKGK